MKIKSLLAFCGLMFSLTLCAQDSLNTKPDSIDYYEMSIEQLLYIKAHGVPSELEKLINQIIESASKKPLPTRESPGIVSIITEEEIQNSGARDIMDVLRLVPGIDFGADVEGVVGLSMRGSWAHEGKVLLLVDGQEQNEILFSTVQFGNHFPVDQISKIEIIRGPGSAIYGGFAEYGVINIITKKGDKLNGINASVNYGTAGGTTARNNYYLSGGFKKKNVTYSIAGMYGKGIRSERDYSDYFGNTTSLAVNSALDPVYLNTGLKVRNFEFRAIVDLYSTKVHDGYDVIDSLPYIEKFNSFFAELKYKFSAGNKWAIVPKFNYKLQQPWNTSEDASSGGYNKVVQRITGGIHAQYDYTHKINFSFGAESYLDKATDLLDSSYFSNGKSTVSYLNIASYGQVLIKSYLVNLTAGARYDKHNVYGDAFVPRIGLTKKINRIHFKFLYSNSFRAPSIENINLAPDEGIKPEYTTVLEFESGYQLTRRSLLSFNIFDITTKNPIVYYYDDSLGTDNYINKDRSGTRGAEVEYRFKAGWGNVLLNYSYYTTAGKSQIDDYSVEGNNKLSLGFPAHKANAVLTVKLPASLVFNTSVKYRSKSYAAELYDSTGVLNYNEVAAGVYINTYLYCKHLFVKGLSVGVGVYDILNTGIYYVQPYAGGHAPLPGIGREFYFKVKYSFGIENKDE